MAEIKDFTGYTWIGNSTISPMFYTVTYSINFTSNNTNYTEFNFENVFDDIIEDRLKYNDTIIYSDFDDVWANDAYKTVIFTGDLSGTEIDRNQLSTWLNENGTIIPPITDLTNYKWTANDTIDDSKMGYEYNINFTSNSNNYSKFAFVNDSSSIPQNSLQYNQSIAYSYDFLQWSNQNYKEIIIKGGTDATNTALINWLMLNGTLTKLSTNKFKLGNSAVKMCLGDTEVNKIYLGTELMYEK